MPERITFFSAIKAVWLLNGLAFVAIVVLDEQSRLIPESFVTDLVTGGTLV